MPVQRAVDADSRDTTEPGQTSTSANEGDSQSSSRRRRLCRFAPTAVAPLLGDSADSMAHRRAVVDRCCPAAFLRCCSELLRSNVPSRQAGRRHRSAPRRHHRCSAHPSRRCPSTGSGDRIVTAREMSLQRMFEPGAAAIASGAAYSDGANSVVFRPPTTTVKPDPPSPATDHADDHDRAGPVHRVTGSVTSSAPMANLPVARSAMAPLPMPSSPPTNPTLGSSFDGGSDGAAVRPAQWLPSVSSLTNGARNAVGGVADTARQTAGSYADTARNTAGGYLNQAPARPATRQARPAATSTRHAARRAAMPILLPAPRAATLHRRAAADRDRHPAWPTRPVLPSTTRHRPPRVRSGVRWTPSATQPAGSRRPLATRCRARPARSRVRSERSAGPPRVRPERCPPTWTNLARRLFDPLSARFKSELWLDRERAGMVTDLRR